MKLTKKQIKDASMCFDVRCSTCSMGVSTIDMARCVERLAKELLAARKQLKPNVKCLDCKQFNEPMSMYPCEKCLQDFRRPSFEPRQ
jgi:hypothetical protein